MNKAYDTLLQTEVTAEMAAESGAKDRTGDFSKYRYECICCGEEVYVAAPYSLKQATHFRHYDGNNDTECDNYLGQITSLKSAIDFRSRRSFRETANFYFDYSKKLFCIGVKFSDTELESLTDQDICVEVTTENHHCPFISIPINRTNFTPDVPTMFYLEEFSNKYLFSTTISSHNKSYDFLKHNMPTIFKFIGSSQDAFAKLVSGSSVYTNTKYFLTVTNHFDISSRIDGIDVSDTFIFTTMSQQFLGLVITISKITVEIEDLIQSWGYQLEPSEFLTVLWPPSSLNDDIVEIYSEEVYLYTSFPLRAHGNISVRSDNIVSQNEISRILIDKRAKIFRRNVELVINRVEEPVICYEALPVTEESANEFRVPQDDDYFLFDQSGVTSLKSGQKIVLTPDSVIKKYFCSYLSKIISSIKPSKLEGQDLLDDILANYKVDEPFDFILFDSLFLSDIARIYLERCKRNNYINSVAKKYIMEGKI